MSTVYTDLNGKKGMEEGHKTRIELAKKRKEHEIE